MSDTKEQPITGRLENWSVRDWGEGRIIVWGNINGDTKGRFSDATYIHTSDFPAIPLKDGDVITTRNSVYLLGKRLRVHCE